MSTDPQTIEIILELLEPLPLTSKRMFGEYAIYLDGKVVALVTDGVFSLKVCEVTDERLTPELLGEAYPGSKPCWRITTDLLEDREWATDLVQRTWQALPYPKPKSSAKATMRAKPKP